MEVEVFNQISARISSLVPDFQLIEIWNNQVERLKSTDENGMPVYEIPWPSLFVEFTPPQNIVQLGNGSQLYDPLEIRLHIIDNQLDSGDGNLERNVDIFTLKQKVFQALQGFEPDGCVAMFRVAEEQDYDHTNLYHYIQTYLTNYVDMTTDAQENALIKEAPTDLNETIEIVYDETDGTPGDSLLD